LSATDTTERMTLEQALALKHGGQRAKPQQRETREQIALFQWRALNVGKIPELKWLHSSGNGYKLDSARAGKIANDSGRTKGVWDVFLPVLSYYNMERVCGLYIEMKDRETVKKTGKVLTPEQEEFRADLQHAFEFAICYSWEEAKDAILDYLGRAK
jgi:hypothetical protein